MCKLSHSGGFTKKLQTLGHTCFFRLRRVPSSVDARADFDAGACDVRARVRVLSLSVARMMSWAWVVSLAPRGGAQEERGGREVARSTCRSWNRLYIVECEYLVLCELGVRDLY